MLLSPRGLRRLRTGTSVYMVAFGASLDLASFQKTGPEDKLIGLMCALQLTASGFLAYKFWASTSPEMDKATFYRWHYLLVFMILLSLPLLTE